MIAIVGETIVGPERSSLLSCAADEKFLKGYNTYSSGGDMDIVAAVNGVVEATDRVVSVRGLSPRYMPEIGDVVVGRIVDVQGNRWRVDVSSLMDAIMLLSNVTEPGGILRRRGRDDELSMRRLFKEDDVVVAEVQRISPDGLVSLHTRTAEKYGKMESVGVLVRVKPCLIRRTRHQFNTFVNFGVTTIIGMNGNIWVCIASEAQIAEAKEKASKKSHKLTSSDDDDDDRVEDENTKSAMHVDVDDVSEVMQMVSFFANCTEVLGRSGTVVFNKTIVAAVKAARLAGLKPYDVLRPENSEAVISAAKSILTKKRKRNLQ